MLSPLSFVPNRSINTLRLCSLLLRLQVLTGELVKVAVIGEDKVIRFLEGRRTGTTFPRTARSEMNCL